MPELPEVQTIVSDLQKVLPGLKVRSIWVGWKKMIKNPSPTKFEIGIIGEKFLKVERRGKNILIHLTHNKTLLIHQKMTGHMLYGDWNKQDPYNRFIRMTFDLSNRKQLALCDMRKFAKVLIWPTDKLDQLKGLSELGPEPLEKSFNLKKFKEVLANKKGKIKQVLMDQKNIAGIGNIYADEILWQASVHPMKLTSKLSEAEIKKIYSAISPLLKKSIKARGTSSSDFRDASGQKGGFQKYLKVYQKEGQPCAKKDGGIIERIKFAGRSSHFCPVHQKL